MNDVRSATGRDGQRQALAGQSDYYAYHDPQGTAKLSTTVVHALADVMGAYPLIIPPGPGVMSAFGFLTSDIQNEFAETYLETEEDVDGRDVYEELRALEADASDWLVSEGVAESVVERAVEPVGRLPLPLGRRDPAEEFVL